MTETKKSNKKVILGAILAVVVIAALVAVYTVFGTKPVAGGKNISIEVVNQAGQATVYEVSTDAEYLKQAMDEAEGLTYGGADSEYGMMIDTVNGELASYTENGAYWSFYVNGEYCNYGIETQPIVDGDTFQIIFTSAQ